MKVLSVGRSLLAEAWLKVTRAQPARLRPLDLTPFGGALDDPADPCAGLNPPLEDRPIPDLQVAMDDGVLTAEALTRHVLRRIRRRDDALGTLIELNPLALDEARASDRRRRSGDRLGPLDGIPVTLKDNIETAAPMRTTAGAAVLADHVAAADATVVERLRAAGAVIIGKANLSELAGAVARTPGVSAVGGRTRNPYGDAFTPGGSSSGSAAGVAAGLCTVSVGTETSGSLLAPAAFNGVVGMKPSRGLVPTDGIVPLVSSQDSAGPITRHVADAAALLAVLAGDAFPRPELSLDALDGVLAAVLRADILSQQTPFEDTSDNAAVLDRITDGLATAGATIMDATFADAGAVKQFEAAFTKFVLGGLVHDTIPALTAAGAPVSTATDLVAFNLQSPRTRMPAGELVLTMACVLAPDAAAYRQAARDNTEAAAAILDAAFDAAGTDLLVSITNRHSSLYATAGYPAITVPVGLRANGMPTGVTFIGCPGTDARLLARAFAFEQATQLRVGPSDPNHGVEAA